MAINTKMSVTGVAEYKRAMTTAAASVREYDSELKLCEAQYKRTGDKSQYLIDKSRILNAQLNEQRKAVANAKAGLADVTAQYGENSKQAIEWRTKLNQARTALVNIKTQIDQTDDAMAEMGISTESASNNVEQLGQESTTAGTKVSQLGNRANSTDDKLGTLGTEAESAGEDLEGLGGNAEDAAGQAQALGTKAGTAGNKVSQLGNRVGTADGKLEGLGGEAETAAGNLTSLGENAEGAGEDAQALGTKAGAAGTKVSQLGNRAGATEGKVGELGTEAGAAGEGLGELSDAAGAAADDAQGLGAKAGTAGNKLSQLGNRAGTADDKIGELGTEAGTAGSGLGELGDAASDAAGNAQSLGTKASGAGTKVAALGSKAGSADDQLSTLGEEAATAGGNVDTLSGNAASAASEASKLGTKAGTAGGKVGQLGSKASSAGGDVSSLGDNAEGVKDELSGMADVAEDAGDKARALGTKAKGAGSGVTTLGSRASSTDSKLGALGEEAANTDGDLEALKDESELAGDKLRAMGTKAGTAGAKVGTLGTKADGADDQIKSVGTESGEAAGKADDLAGSASAAGEAIGSINDKLNAQAVIEGLDNITEHMAGAARKAASLAKSLWDMGADAGQWADQLLTESNTYNLDTTTIQQWRYAADQIDTDVTTIFNAKRKFESSGAPDMLASIGVNAYDSSGQLRDWQDLLWDSLAVLGAMDNETERNAAAQEIFGKSYNDMIPLIRAGREAWEESASKATYVSEDQVHALGELDDTINSMNASWETLKTELLTAIAPALQTVAEGLTTIANKVHEFLQTEEGQKAMQGIADSLSGIVETVVNKDTIETALTTITGGIQALTGALSWIGENKETVVGALEALGAAFLGLKVSSGVLEFVKLISAGKGLLNGPGLRNLGSAMGGGSGSGTGTAGAAGAGMNAKVASGALSNAWWSVGVPAAVVAAATLPAVIANQQAVKQRDQERQELEDRSNAAADTIGSDADAMRQAMAVALSGYEGGTDAFGMRRLASLGEVERALTGLKDFDWLADILSPDTWAQLQAIGTEASTLDPYQVTELLQTITNTMADHMETLAAQAETDGLNTGYGLANGIRKASPDAWDAAEALANGVINRLGETLQINSPSRVMAQYGAYTGQGFAEGITGSIAEIQRAASGMAVAAMSGSVTMPRAAAAQAGGQPYSVEALGTALRAALSGVSVTMSGEQVGELVSDTVDREIGRAAYNARYSV